MQKVKVICAPIFNVKMSKFEKYYYLCKEFANIVKYEKIDSGM